MLTIYSKNNCPFCDQAKSLVESKGVAYNVINVEEDVNSRKFLVDQGLRSVPQIFQGTTIVPGGYQGLESQTETFWQQF
jgi:glutaredoxin 3